MPSKLGRAPSVMKNCDALVCGPWLAIATMPRRSCFSTKFSSANVGPDTASPAASALCKDQKKWEDSGDDSYRANELKEHMLAPLAPDPSMMSPACTQPRASTRWTGVSL